MLLELFSDESPRCLNLIGLRYVCRTSFTILGIIFKQSLKTPIVDLVSIIYRGKKIKII